MDRHIKEVLGHYLKKSKISNGYKTSKIIDVWKEKMGSSIAQQTEYIRLKDRTLNIKITSSVLKFELFQNTEQIKTFLNEALDSDDLIQEVKFL